MITKERVESAIRCISNVSDTPLSPSLDGWEISLFSRSVQELTDFLDDEWTLVDAMERAKQTMLLEGCEPPSYEVLERLVKVVIRDNNSLIKQLNEAKGYGEPYGGNL